ncbi:MAG: right-handed parallel beta-helix repeat-containing protein [Sphingomonadaceae bacterium]|nr:right-handed parallel beta-helix repeat-containing protein [Sphingomonadaceae bacterium]
MRRVRWALLGAALLASGSGSAATYVVTAATLANAFKTAAAGDTLKLVGTFGLVRLPSRSFAKVVTLDASRAVFTDTLDLLRDDNVRVVGGHWDITRGSTYGRAIVVYGGSGVSIDRATVVGVAGQQGVNFAGTANAEVSGGSFAGLQVAIGLTGVTGGSATGNRVTRAVSDGIDIGDSHNVTASGNSCSGGTPGAGVHPDCIQLWSTEGHPVESDITVTHNSATGMTQGFTSFAAGGGARRVDISYNTVTTSMPQGIACYDCFDSIISYNTLSTLPGASHLTNLNIVGGGNNNIVGNVINPASFLRRNGVGSVNATPFTDLLVYAGDVQPAPLGSAPPVSTAGPAVVPEPASWAMLLAGFAAVGAAARRRVRRVCA